MLPPSKGTLAIAVLPAVQDLIVNRLLIIPSPRLGPRSRNLEDVGLPWPSKTIDNPFDNGLLRAPLHIRGKREEDL